MQPCYIATYTYKNSIGTYHLYGYGATVCAALQNLIAVHGAYLREDGKYEVAYGIPKGFTETVLVS